MSMSSPKLVARSSPDTGVIAGLAGAGALILILLVVVVTLIIRARRNHKRLLADLESRGLDITRRPSVAEISDPTQRRTRTVLRRNNSFIPYGGCQSGWNTLDSYESFQVGQAPDYVGPWRPPPLPISTVEAPPEGEAQTAKLPRWPFSKRIYAPKPSRPNGALSRLSAITEAFSESPRSQQVTPMPIIPDPDESGPDPFGYFGANRDQRMSEVKNEVEHDREEQRPNSPLLDIPALPAQRPAPLRQVNEASSVRLVQSSRSMSLTSLPSTLPKESSFSAARPPMHQRSMSLCTQKSGHAPAMPAPPLPVQMSAEEKRSSMVQVSPSRASVSSIDSGGSSVLVNSPYASNKWDRGAKSEGVPNYSWCNSRTNRPRPVQGDIYAANAARELRRHHTADSHRPQNDTSGRYRGADLENARRGRSTSATAYLTGHGPQSAGGLVASHAGWASVTSPASIRKPLTPSSRRHSRVSVDAKGSPTHRGSLTLSEVSEMSDLSRDDANLPLHTPTSQDNGFHWDLSPTQAEKPSAMKGSPNGRKGHRRQNCVRISLAPTILGPSTGSLRSPRMNKIQEESFELEEHSAGTTDENPPRDLPRPPSSSVFSPDIRISPGSTRASLTPSSPTISLVNFCKDNGLPLDRLGLASSQSSPSKRNSTRLSTHSSQLSIPSFPSPGKDPTKNTPALPIPSADGFRPSMDTISGSEKTADEVYQDALSSPKKESPTSPLQTEEDLMAAFISLSSDGTTGSPENNQNADEPANSPPKLLTVKAGWSLERPISPRYIPASSPPCSPKSRPTSAHLETVLAAEAIVTPASINAIAKDGELRCGTILVPPIPSSPENRLQRRSNTVSGPRAEPVKPLTKAVQMLRRMNSDVGHENRAERRYLDLGTRGTSPGLPGPAWRDSYADLNAYEQPAVGDIDLLKESGIGRLDDDYDLDVEIDIDEMLRSSMYGGNRSASEREWDLSWLDSDDTNPWDREDSGMLDMMGKIEPLSGTNTSQEKDQRGNTDIANNSRSSVWNDGERFWDQKNLAGSPSPAAGSIESRATDLPNDDGHHSFQIPGLSLTSPSTPPSPQRESPPKSLRSTRTKDTPSQRMPGILKEAKKKRPERMHHIRKSAILNLSVSAHNKQPVYETRVKNVQDENGSLRTTARTPDPKLIVQPGAGSSPVERNIILETPGSLYDEDGFLKA